MAAGLAMLKTLRRPGFYQELEEKSDRFAEALAEIGAKAPVPAVLNRIGSMMTCFFTDAPVIDFDSAMQANTDRYGQYFRQMLAKGFWLAPSQFEALFISAAHTPEQLEQALTAIETSLTKLSGK
jgi:glutamate-1-semialdehyde 2,1-aminomutase